ncbi:unnamed protein product [Cuscuta epithymum]|uniref:Uncharacterized protein n=1 Tax=Cuscuta epithymum TaxID=186058 RepID=A0AAV0DGD7_9ASTE|nr:unnamed protein product [Cuscuta epithymum]
MDFSGFENENIIDTTVDDFWAELAETTGGSRGEGDIPAAAEVEREPAAAEVEREPAAAAADLDGEPEATADLDGEPAMDDVPEHG